MNGKQDTDEFKIATFKEVAQRGHPTREIADRLAESI